LFNLVSNYLALPLSSPDRMNEIHIIHLTSNFVKQELIQAEAGHDWSHVKRVWTNAKHIAQFEQVNTLVVEIAALLHDIADSKFHQGDETIGPKKAREFLESIQVDENIIQHVILIIQHISFKGGNFELEFSSPELLVVQDADRLDAIGAIGIARAFHYGGFKNREIFNPAIQPKLNMNREEYKNDTGPTINHFYEKLLLLKDRMNTQTGKELAEQRHQFMQNFLDQFHDEMQGKR
jgi:uncharacterized protein